jgi:hypothetical protein
MNFLIEAAQYLIIKPVYYTPKKVIDKITYECIIGNPPYNN